MKFLRFWRYVIRASWHSAMGRWYVWRDAPTDVVRQVAVLWYLERKSPRDESSALIEEAYNEYKLRKLRGER